MRLTALPLLPVLVLTAGCAAPASDTTSDPSSSRTAQQESPGSPSASSASSSAPSPSATGTPARTGVELIAADSDYGPMLYDGTGQPIYLFTAETGSRPACYDACAADWPPVLTTGKPSGLGDVRDSLLGTTVRDDGATQVTYAGHPLYFYAHEGKYQVLCHDVDGYGGTWLVVQPDGTAAPG